VVEKKQSLFNIRLFKKIYFPLKIRILVIIVLPVILYPLIIIYFNKYQDILINSEFEAIERQGLTFSKAIGMAENQYGLIEKNKISGFGLQTLLPFQDKNYKLHARLYNVEGKLIADSNEGIFNSKVEISKLPLVKKKFELEEYINKFVTKLSKIVSQPIDFSKFDNHVIENFKNSPPEIDEALNGKVTKVLRKDKTGNLILFVALPIKNLRVIRGAVLISSSSDRIEHELLDLEKELFKTLGIILLATLGLGVYLVKSITNPIIKLAKYADYITENKTVRLDKISDFPIYKDEIGDLSNSFSKMIKEIQIRVDHIANFGADVAHELKNPLTSLRSASETLIKIKNKGDQEKLINIIQKDIERINRLISDISLSSKLDAELSRIKFKRININKLIETLIEVRRVSLGYKFKFKSKFKDLYIQGNENKIVQVLDNLIDNAFSFSPKKKPIEVELKLKNKKVYIIIEDQGKGFPENALPKVFNRFYTERPETEEFGKHSGLGLSISKQIIEAHNGEILVENRINAKNNVFGARVIIILDQFG
tara:strand:+ start:778 stop:2397 length:1620 start_codon:yes stop_codon:yes gene_type:complete